MASTYELIASQTLGSAASSVTFSSIPQTYDDLLLTFSARTTDTSGDGFGMPLVRFNSDTGSTYSYRRIMGTGSAASSSSGTSTYIYSGLWPGAVGTANTFSSHELYIPNYTGSQHKSVSCTTAAENNATLGYLFASASLWASTSAITTVSVEGNFTSMITGSSFYLYGVTHA